MKKILIFSLIISIIFLASGCASSVAINYKDNRYIYCDNPTLETVDNINNICRKVGSIKGSDAYTINNEPTSDWIYLDAQSMSDSPVGLYKSTKVKMNSLSDFHANQIFIIVSIMGLKPSP
jgi:hypothetical protein